jgi:hypothetical protein
MRPTALVLGAALCAVLFASQADARPKHHFVGVNNMVTCSDPVMRPCGGALNFEGSVRHHPKRLKRFANHPKGGDLVTTPSIQHMPPGLHRVLAEGAGRVVNWIRPRAWCGWFMRHEFGVANPAANVARWWAGYGRPAHGPHVGAIVVWRHHVGRITGRTADGQFVVKSGNDGNAVRERVRSLRGAIAFRWPY